MALYFNRESNDGILGTTTPVLDLAVPKSEVSPQLSPRNPGFVCDPMTKVSIFSILKSLLFIKVLYASYYTFPVHALMVHFLITMFLSDPYRTAYASTAANPLHSSN